ncbi:MAG: hypothetical protein J5685_03665 [Clostridiales bacterium]|nr:hypothetical protein [Clostridiales bacterium]
MGGFQLPGWAIVVIVCVVCGTVSGIVNKIIDSKKKDNVPSDQNRSDDNGEVKVDVKVDNVDDYIKLKDYEKKNMQCPFCGSRAGVGEDGVCKGCGGRVG